MNVHAALNEERAEKGNHVNENSEPTIRVCMILDTPNLSTGVATAGLPARMVSLAAALQDVGAEVSFVLGDRGMTEKAAKTWGFPSLLVHPDLLYGPAESLVPLLTELAPDFIIITDPQVTALNGRIWAERTDARLVYEAHDDEEQLSRDGGDDEIVAASKGAWQLAAAQTADFVTVLTEREANTMRHFGIDEERLLIAPIGINMSERTSWGPQAESRRLLMIGNLFYHPNALAVRFLIELIDELNGRGHNVTARIVGRGPEDLTECDAVGVEFVGPVANLDEIMSDVALAVAPLTVGSGQKKKLLDYAAAALPVLATTEATNGYAAGHPGVVVNDDLSAWADEVVRLLADAEQLRSLGEAGRQAIFPKFDSTSIAVLALNCYRTWLDMPLQRDLVLLPHQESNEPTWLIEHANQLGLGDPILTATQPAVNLPL